MTMRSNTVCWNPMEAYYFTSSNEDYKSVQSIHRTHNQIQCLYDRPFLDIKEH